MNYQEFLEILSNPILGLVLNLIGIFLSYFLYWKQIQLNQIYWDFKSYELTSSYTDFLPRLNIKYGHKKVQRLTLSRVIVWNPGLQTIKWEDISSVSTLNLAINDGDILDVTITQKNNPNLHVNFLWAENRIFKKTQLMFEALKPNEGFIADIVHSGTANNNALEFLGEIKDGYIRKKTLDSGLLKIFDAFILVSWLWIKAKPRRKRIIQKNFLIVTSIFVLLTIPLLLPLLVEGMHIPSNNESMFMWLWTVRFLLRYAISFVFAIYALSTIWKIPTIPEGLEFFFE